MATPGYTEELQPSQPQGGSVTTPKSGQQKASPTVTPTFLPDMQSSSSSSPSQAGLSSRITQTTPPAILKKAVLATPTQVTAAAAQYAVSEIQSSASGSSNGQNTPQYIVVTVSEGSIHSNDSVSDSSPPPTVQTGVPTHVVQTAQQRSVVQTTAKSGQHGVGNLHITPEISQVGHVYSSQVQYGDGDSNYNNTSIRSSTYPFTESSLYGQATPSGPYYDDPPTSGSQVSTPVTSQPVSVTTGFSGGGTGVTVVSGASSSGGGGGGAGTGVVAGGGAGGVASAGGAGGYVVPGTYVMGSGGQNYTHNIRASPATVQWLLDNYEKAEGVSLPRCTLYYHYLLHCQEAKLEPVNAASFGKLIRSMFVGLRTRRLGTRGNSKYHYYGLRIKSSSPLHRLVEDQQHLAMRQQPFSHKHRIRPVQKVEGMTNGMAVGAGQGAGQGVGLFDISSQIQQYQQFLDASRSLPEFPEIDLQGKALPEGILLEHIRAFQQLYREHCEAIVDVMVNLQFPLVETLWKSFWRFSEGQTNEALDLHSESEKRLPKACLVLLCQYEPVLQWSRNCDNTLYQTLVEILIPDVLTPIPSALTQAIRNCAKSLENWLTSAMMNIPEEMVRIKVVCAGAFAQTLRRYTSLNHLAQAARAVLQNSAQITQMLNDLNRVDFNNVQEQASWVCACEERTVQRIEQDFKMTLQQQKSLEQWAAWLDSVVTHVLKPYTSSPSFTKAAKLFLLKWSFYSSMVIRDLTLRSAASFGSFHLIRLLYDEYMYYLVEHRVAQAKGETPIAVMGEFANLGRNDSAADADKEEEEEEEDESDEDQMPIPVSSTAMGEESLEPPAKLARTDLFNSTHN
ncbi:MHC class II regulatory factor RFX1 isoform X1 [Pangasianodon hypophthalmus]|uniref:MHC class II regulatory factor RFX1 isoform X1 n=1 Tax=Pangasianodon hypophthalmus TaxID=310915 RepID=UPI0023080870|nr:MHC class II regulatory factor RFX1 isoform X1 [Pangasianodon hypophthalmus]